MSLPVEPADHAEIDEPLVVAAMNLAHVGLEPCRMPTAPAVRAANWVFGAFGIATFIAVPAPQAAVIVVALLAQAVSAHRTLPGASLGRTTPAGMN